MFDVLGRLVVGYDRELFIVDTIIAIGVGVSFGLFYWGFICL